MQELRQKAIDLAREKHAGQTDKAGVDYFDGHLTNVARILRDELGGSVLHAIAAYLHDIVEDTDVTLDDIERDFGPMYATIVDALTRRDGETYADFIDRAASHGAVARKVKLADVLDHLTDTGALPHSMIKRYQRALMRLDT